MQNLSVIVTVIVAAAAIIAVLLWRLKASPAVDIEPFNKRIQEEIQKAEGIQAKLDTIQGLLRTAEANCAAAKASETAETLRADTADSKTNQLKSEFDALQKQWNDAEPKIATAVEQKKAAEDARAIIAHRQEILEQQNVKMQSDLTDAVGRAATANADVENARAQMTDMASTIEALQVSLATERKNLAAALAKQQSDEDAANKLENLSHAVLEKTMTETEQRLEKIVKSLQKSSGDELEKHADKVALTLEPLQAKLLVYDDAIKRMAKDSQESHGSLRQQIIELKDAEISLNKQAKALTTALSASPKVKGSYGELMLKQLVEFVGMHERCHFETQASRETEEGRKIPDMVVSLPGGQKVLVDSKAVMDACVEAQQSDDDAHRTVLLKKHCDNVRSRVADLASKNYFADHRDAVEAVVLFLPAENLYATAVENDPGLTEFAMTRNIIVCGPNSLMMLLKVANQLWQRASIEEEALKIKECGDSIYKSACDFVEKFAKIGTKIRQLEGDYNDAAGTLDGRLIPRGREMSRFTSVSNSRELEDVTLLKEDIREFRSAEAKKLLAISTERLPGLVLGEFETAELTLASGEK